MVKKDVSEKVTLSRHLREVRTFRGRAVQIGEIASAKAQRGSVPFTQMGKDLWEVNEFYFGLAASEVPSGHPVRVTRKQE